MKPGPLWPLPPVDMNEPIVRKSVEAGGELLEHVAADGTVLEIVTRAQMREGSLRHRCTYVFVLRSNGHLVVHQRASWKSIYAGYWDLAFGGVCGVGESWEESAGRELAEEAGLTRQDLGVDGLVELGPIRYDVFDGHIVGRVYLAGSDATLTCPDGEVAATDEIGLHEISGWLEGRQVCSDSMQEALPLLLNHLNMS